MRSPSNTNAGFTLIEMLVSLSLFTIVVTITLGSFLVLISGNQGFVARQSVMDTLAFSFDSMTREIRTGNFYVCMSAANITSQVVNSGFIPGLQGAQNGQRRFFDNSRTHHDALGERARNCPGGSESGAANGVHGLSVIEGGDSITGPGVERIMYYFSRADQTLYRRVGNNTAERIVPEGIIIENAEFFVTGAERLSGGNTEQPAVTIIITAREVDADPADTITLQTTITQRSFDL